MADEKTYMLNVLWFRPDGGAQKYAEYIAAAAPFVEKYGGRVLESYVPEMAVIGDWNPDMLFVVEWPSWEAFLKLPADDGYMKIAPLREEAITNSLLIKCRAGFDPSFTG
jgi:uncharacterized protein (DUF1330 family)